MTGGGPMLVLNLGSATLKAAWFDPAAPSADSAPARRVQLSLSASDDSRGHALLRQVAAALDLAQAPVRVAHRVVHGGNANTPRRLDAVERDRLRALSPLAPLHQPPALALVDAVEREWPQAEQWAVFDTAWHATLPAATRRLAVPEAWDGWGIRRYGFHGLAFAATMRWLRDRAPERAGGRLVLAHLGGGSSLCAVHDGRSIDTTMSMTPLDGLPMSTRSGSLDPGALLYLLRERQWPVDALEQALYRDCGLRGLSGVSGDMRELLRQSGHAGVALALEVFALRVAQGIAAMATTLGGIDDLAFSGGIGAHAAQFRLRVVAHLRWLGVGLDEDANTGQADRIDAGGRVQVWRVEPDEESEIAIACMDVDATVENDATGDRWL